MSSGASSFLRSGSSVPVQNGLPLLVCGDEGLLCTQNAAVVAERGKHHVQPTNLTSLT